MLPIILVLAIAASAFAAPSIQSIQPAKGLSRSGPLLQRANYAVVDGGDVSVLTLNAEAVLQDLSVVPEGQNIALGVGVALLGDLAVGKAGDACASATYINQFVESVRNGGRGIGNSLNNYISAVSRNIDNIVNAVNNRPRARYSSGSRSGCPAEGREYQFEPAWNSILGAAKSSQLGLLQEQYCSAKRLYNAFTARNNNAAAHITASSLPSTVEVYDRAGLELFNFIQALATGVNPAAPAAQLQKALSKAAQIVTSKW